MKKRRVLIAVLMTILSVAIAVPTGATPPSGVHIEGETSLWGHPNWPLSPFVASGPAVDTGLICTTGYYEDVRLSFSGDSQNGWNVHLIRHFTCDDGSGEFFMNFQARVDYRKGSTWNWNILSGTDAYEKLHGSGSGISLPICGENCALDIFDGNLHID